MVARSVDPDHHASPLYPPPSVYVPARGNVASQFARRFVSGSAVQPGIAAPSIVKLMAPVIGCGATMAVQTTADNRTGCPTYAGSNPTAILVGSPAQAHHTHIQHNAKLLTIEIVPRTGSFSHVSNRVIVSEPRVRPEESSGQTGPPGTPLARRYSERCLPRAA